MGAAAWTENTCVHCAPSKKKWQKSWLLGSVEVSEVEMKGSRAAFWRSPKQTLFGTYKTCSTSLTLLPATLTKCPEPKRLSSRERLTDERKDTVSPVLSFQKAWMHYPSVTLHWRRKSPWTTRLLPTYVKSWKERRSKSVKGGKNARKKKKKKKKKQPHTRLQRGDDAVGYSKKWPLQLYGIWGSQCRRFWTFFFFLKIAAKRTKKNFKASMYEPALTFTCLHLTAVGWTIEPKVSADGSREAFSLLPIALLLLLFISYFQYGETASHRASMAFIMALWKISVCCAKPHIFLTVHKCHAMQKSSWFNGAHWIVRLCRSYDAVLHFRITFQRMTAASWREFLFVLVCMHLTMHLGPRLYFPFHLWNLKITRISTSKPVLSQVGTTWTSLKIRQLEG